MNYIKRLINRLARRIVETEIKKEIGYHIRADAYWFDSASPEHKAVYEIGDQLIKYEHWNIQQIRESNKLTAPDRPYNKCVILYPNGQIRTSMNSSNETHEVIRKAFERTMPERIWNDFINQQKSNP